MFQIKTILVLKLDFIGDFITILPALRLLVKLYPNATLSLVCAPVVAELAEATGYFDEIKKFNFFNRLDRNELSCKQEFQRIFRRPFDLAIDFRVDSDTRPLLQYVDARFRAGIGSIQDFPFLDISLPAIREASRFIHNKEAPEETKEIPQILQFIKVTAGICFKIVILPFKLVKRFLALALGSIRAQEKGSKTAPPRQDPKSNADLWIGEYILLLCHLCFYRLSNLDNVTAIEFSKFTARPSPIPTICIAPFANTDTRSWPASYFRKLLELILERTSCQITMLGPEQQSPAIAAMIEGLPEKRVRNDAGKFSLTEVISVLRGCKLLIANNSGLAHLGGATGTRVLAIYSASHGVREWGARGPSVRTLTADVECRFCSLESLQFCKNNHVCMTLITPEFIFAHIENILSDAAISDDLVIPHITMSREIWSEL